MSSSKFWIENGIMHGERMVFERETGDLGKWFLETLRSKPDFVGQVDPNTGEELNYGKMADESVRCALWLRKQGLKSGDIVFICCRNQMSTYVPILATFYNSAAIILGYKEANLELVIYLFNLLKPKFIFSEGGEVEIFSKAIKEENLDTKIVVFTKVPGFHSLNDILSQSELKEVDGFSCFEPKNPDDNCILALTSGATGDPKIVEHSYRSIMEALLICTNVKKQNEIVSMCNTPLQWFFALVSMLVDILLFTKRIMIKEASYNYQKAFQLIEKYKVEEVRFSLGMIYRMHKDKAVSQFDTSSVRTSYFGGMKLQPEILKFLMQLMPNSKLVQVYGTSELSIGINAGIMNNIDLNSCGYLFPNISMKVIDVETGAILGPEDTGEIYIKSPCIMKSYFKNKKATDEAFDLEGWYRTGDLGYYDNSGLVYVHGRVKNSLMVQNETIVPLWNVEHAILLNSEVIQHVIISGSQLSDQSRMFAFVTLIPGSKITEDELSEMVNNLSDITITVKILKEMPLTSNGKIRLSELKNIAENAIKNNL